MPQTPAICGEYLLDYEIPAEADEVGPLLAHSNGLNDALQNLTRRYVPITDS